MPEEKIPPGYVKKTPAEMAAKLGRKAPHPGYWDKLWFGFMMRLGHDYILKPITTMMSITFMWVFNALVKASPGRARWIADKVVEQYFQVDSVWANFVASYMSSMTRGIVSGAELTGKNLSQMSDTVSHEFVRSIFDRMLGMVMPTPSEIEADPLKGAEKYLGVNMQFQMDAWMLHMLGDMQSFGIFKSLKDLPNAISWSFGLGWLSWLVMGVPFRIGISTPMERKFNSIYTMERLTPLELCKATRAGYMDPDTFLKQMAEYGWSVENALLKYDTSAATLTDADLKLLWQLGLIDKKYIRDQHGKKGYTQSEARLLTDVLVNDRKLKIRDKIIKEAVDLFEAGELSEGDLTKYLSVAGYIQEEIDMQVTASQLAKESKGKLSNSDLANAVEKDLIAWSEGREKLQLRGFSWEEAEIFLKLRVEILTNFDIAKAVDKEIIGWSAALDKLQARGLSRDEADMFLKLRIPKEKWS